MINFLYDNNQLTIDVKNEINSVLSQEDFPLVLNIIDNSNRVHFMNKELHVGHFSTCFDVTYKKAIVYTCKGLKLATWDWSTMIHGDLSHRLFHIWSKKNKGVSGIVIGAHNGTSGEWVGPVLNGEIKAVLIEPSDTSYEILRKSYENRGFVDIEKVLITPSGGEFTFYQCDEFQQGQLNSIFVDNLTSVVDKSKIKEVRLQSMTILDILKKYNISKNKWWLQIDAEGLDSDLLMNSDLSDYSLPCCLIFEKREQNQDIDNWLSANGYIYFQSNLNVICFR